MDTNNDNTNTGAQNATDVKQEVKKVKKPFWTVARKRKAKQSGLYCLDKVVTLVCVVGGLALASLVSMKDGDTAK